MLRPAWLLVLPAGQRQHFPNTPIHPPRAVQADLPERVCKPFGFSPYLLLGKASSKAAIMPLAWGRPSLHTGSPQYPAVLTRTSRPGPEPAAGSGSCSKGRTPPTLLTSLGEKQFLRELGHPHADLEFLVPR